ncbi:MAG: hypothetical protein KTR20_04465 [Cellvibrionaceae bacterium]|nr:hypothetical protein [Cellvibrionaceae bacterium]
MSKLHWIAYVEDIKNNHCTQDEEQVLLDIFKSQMKRTATTLARMIWFKLEDFNLSYYAGPNRDGIKHFDLMIERRMIDKQTQWWGTFTHGDKKLEVIGTLERD